MSHSCEKKFLKEVKIIFFVGRCRIFSIKTKLSVLILKIINVIYTSWRTFDLKVNGIAKPSELLAIMGASGAGT